MFILKEKKCKIVLEWKKYIGLLKERKIYKTFKRLKGGN